MKKIILWFLIISQIILAQKYISPEVTSGYIRDYSSNLSELEMEECIIIYNKVNEFKKENKELDKEISNINKGLNNFKIEINNFKDKLEYEKQKLDNYEKYSLDKYSKKSIDKFNNKVNIINKKGNHIKKLTDDFNRRANIMNKKINILNEKNLNAKKLNNNFNKNCTKKVLAMNTEEKVKEMNDGALLTIFKINKSKEEENNFGFDSSLFISKNNEIQFKKLKKETKINIDILNLSKGDLYKYIQNAHNKYNKTLPIVVDKMTTITSSRVEKNPLKIIYYYTLNETKENNILLDIEMILKLKKELKNGMKKINIKRNCSFPETFTMLQSGVILSFVYNWSSGEYLFEYQITKKDCLNK